MSGIGGRPWRRARDACLAASRICHLCGHPGAGEADHLVPVSLGGPRYDPANLRPAHGVRSRCVRCDPVRGKACNQNRQARPVGLVAWTGTPSRDW